MNRLPRFLDSGLAALALPVAAPALAQQEAGGLEEVVVTAERREANLQETPVTLDGTDRRAGRGPRHHYDAGHRQDRSQPAVAAAAHLSPRRSRSGCAAASSRPAA